MKPEKTKSFRILSLILTVMMLVGMMPTEVLAIEETRVSSSVSDEAKTQVSVNEIAGKPGSNVDMFVKISGNTGIANAKLTLNYDPSLKLTEIKEGSALSVLDFTAPGKNAESGSYETPCAFLWDSVSGETNSDGIMLILTFEIPVDAELGHKYLIDFSCTAGDFANEELSPIKVEVLDGVIEVIEYNPGDINDDGRINGTDVTLLRQYIAGGYGVTIITEAGDVNSDGNLNGTDVTLIRRYIAGGYGVELKPAKVICSHELTEITANPATCTETGNIAYWNCSLCGNYYRDTEAIIEVSLAEVTIEAKGHIEEIIPAVPSTPDATGLTEGKKCSVCQKILKEQEVTEKLYGDQYSITYSNTKSTTVTEATKYYSKLGLSELPTISELGYKFEGWYDSNGNKVNSIPMGTTGAINLTAKWSLIEYTITYDCGNGTNSSNNITANGERKYTVESPTFTLADADLPGFAFLRWEDEHGNEISKVEKGTTGNIHLTAIWTSMRYVTVPVSKIQNPKYTDSFYFDAENDMYTFVYYLGCVENVPMSDATYVFYNGLPSVTIGYEVSSATTTSVENSLTTAKESTISTNISSTISAKEEVEVPASKTSIEASITASIGASETVSESNTVSSVVTKSTDTSKSFELTIPDGSPKGYYRMVYMGTVDMFSAIVYDAKNDTYEIVEYSLIRDTSSFALDYSTSSSFDDHLIETINLISQRKQKIILYCCHKRPMALL